MIRDYFELGNLTVIKDDFISFDISLNKQTSELYEDMFQAQASNNVILDIGWYGETEGLKGKFVLYLIKDQDWENPLLKISTQDLNILKYYIGYTMQYLSKF